jgi:hypothetical protein
MSPTDDPEIDPAEARRLGEVLAALAPELDAMLREHLEDNYGEVLGTLYLGEVAKWFTSGEAENVERRRNVAAALAREYETGNEYIQTVIVTGFLENLPFPGEAGRGVVDILPPPLLDALAQLEGGGTPAN